MFPLVRYFSIVSAVIVVVAMIAVTAVLTRLTTEQLIEERQSASVALTQTFSNSIWREFRDHIQASAELDGDALRAHPLTLILGDNVRELMHGLSVVKVKIFALNGNTVFSTQASQMGATKQNSSGFRAASKGQVISDISHRNKFDAIERQIFEVDVVSSYVPIRNKDGKIEGVFEVYDNVTETLEKVTWRRNIIIAFVGLLFALLYVGLFIVVRRAAKVMRQQHFEIANAKSTLEQANARLSDEIKIREEAQIELEHINKKLIERSQELVAAQQTLVQQERLATLGELTATVSHELRNPLGTIRSSLFLIKKKIEGRSIGVEGALERAERNIVRCDNIIKELLGFASEPMTNREHIDADHWLSRTLNEQDAPEGIEIAKEFGAPGARLLVDQEQMRRAVINIVENAFQALLETTEDQPRRLLVRTVSEGNCYKIVFEDTGPGMDPETLGKVFEPLFSTKSYGCGLGLPTVKKIIEKHEGDIHYDSKVGEGTTVTISLPLPLDQERAA